MRCTGVATKATKAVRCKIRVKSKMSRNEKKGHGGKHTLPKKWSGARRPAGPSTTALCSVGPDLGTNYLQSILSDSLGPVVNILTIFSNANILKNTTSKVSVVRY